MDSQQNINFQRIAEAIRYLSVNFREQPDLDEVARQVNLSPFHFQRLFTDWAGVSPKKFLQYLSLDYAKHLLRERQASLSVAAFETGLSGTGRLHDLFIGIEGMTPAEYKNGGASLCIRYSFGESPFGTVLVAATDKGICHLAFADDRSAAARALQQRFPRALFQDQVDTVQQRALDMFQATGCTVTELKLHLKGTPFQLKVWEALLRIPTGTLETYGSLAKALNLPTASRAVGTAVGDNPVAFLIPCHRIIRSTGAIGGYHWGVTRKSAMIAWEAAHTQQKN